MRGRFIDMDVAYMSTSDVGRRIVRLWRPPISSLRCLHTTPLKRVDGDFGQVTSVRTGMKDERVYKSVRN